MNDLISDFASSLVSIFKMLAITPNLAKQDYIVYITTSVIVRTLSYDSLVAQVSKQLKHLLHVLLATS